MKNKVLSSVLAIIFLLSCCICLTGCDWGVTPFGYATYKTSDQQVLRFSSTMTNSTHIWVFEKESDVPSGDYSNNGAQYRLDCDSACMISIEFGSILGVEEIDDTKCTLVNMKTVPFSIRVKINKSSSIYSDTKDVYINDTKLAKKTKYDIITDNQYVKIYYFEDFAFNRSNTNGKINSSIINLIEYK